MEFMSERIIKLEEELKKKVRQLEEFLPPQSITKKDPEVIINSCIEAAVQNVITKDIGSVLCDHLSYTPRIIKLTNNRFVLFVKIAIVKLKFESF